MVFVTASRQGLKLFLSLANHEDFPAADTQKDTCIKTSVYGLICIWTDLRVPAHLEYPVRRGPIWRLAKFGYYE